MSITDKANIRPSNNNVILQTFKKPVPAFCILILNKGKDDVNTQNRNAVNIVPLYFPVRKVPSIHRIGRQ